MTTNQLPQITLAALASINSAAFSETANLNQAREVAKLVLDSYELSSGEFVNMTWQPNGALFNKLSKMGVDYAQQFVEGLHAIAYSELKRHTKETKRAAACIYWRLVEAAEKHAAAQQPANEPTTTANENYTQIAIDLVAELENCNVQRFFEIRNQIHAIGYRFEKSRVIDCFDVANALEAAGVRLGIVVVGDERNPIAGYKKFIVLDVFIGWVLDKPNPTTKPRELVELDECLNAQIAAAATVDAITAGGTNELFAQTTNGEWAHVQDAADEADMSVEQYLFDRNTLSHAQFIQQQADEKGIALGDYLDLYPEAAEFDSLDFSEVVQTYKKAETIDENSDSEAQSATELLIVNFIKFLLPRATERIGKTIAQNEKIGVCIYDYAIDRICDNLDSGDKNYPISLYVINGKDCYLKCKHFDLADGYENSPTVSIDDLNHFQTFYSKEMRQFFQTIFAIPS